jgi:peroxiredoxin
MVILPFLAPPDRLHPARTLTPFKKEDHAMTIKVGEKIPSATLTQMTDKGPAPVTTDELFADKKVVLFAVPGAFTPTCSARHLPGYVEHAADFAKKGVDNVVCLSVNDAFVMGAWGKSQNAEGKVQLLADGNGDFTKKLGLELDATKYGMGVRSQRYAAIVENGVIKALEVEEGGAFKVSAAEYILGKL